MTLEIKNILPGLFLMFWALPHAWAWGRAFASRFKTFCHSAPDAEPFETHCHFEWSEAQNLTNKMF